MIARILCLLTDHQPTTELVYVAPFYDDPRRRPTPREKIVTCMRCGKLVARLDIDWREVRRLYGLDCAPECSETRTPEGRRLAHHLSICPRAKTDANSR